MKNQVLSIDQMQRLKELGVDTSKSNIYWVRRSHGSRINDSSKGNWFLSLQKEFMGVGFTAHEVIPTFTLQDIIDILPGSIDNNVLTIRKHVNPRNQECIYTIEGGLNRRYCIPYNEETAHLVGETDDYEGDEIEKIIKECKLTEGKLD